MRRLSRRLQLLQLGRQRLLEQFSFNTGCFASGHSRLINAVQHTRHGGEEMWAQDLCVLQQSEWVTREEADATADCGYSQFNDTLFFFRMSALSLVRNE
jgi:hypothetical protein